MLFQHPLQLSKEETTIIQSIDQIALKMNKDMLTRSSKDNHSEYRSVKQVSPTTTLERVFSLAKLTVKSRALEYFSVSKFRTNQTIQRFLNGLRMAVLNWNYNAVDVEEQCERKEEEFCFDSFFPPIWNSSICCL